MGSKIDAANWANSKVGQMASQLGITFTDPWCQDFVKLCFKSGAGWTQTQANATATGNGNDLTPLGGAALPQKGDTVFCSGMGGHWGIVYACSANSTITVIEGNVPNSSDNNGSGPTKVNAPVHRVVYVYSPYEGKYYRRTTTDDDPNVTLVSGLSLTTYRVN
jgi:hypothetical protein